LALVNKNNFKYLGLLFTHVGIPHTEDLLQNISISETKCLHLQMRTITITSTGYRPVGNSE